MGRLLHTIFTSLLTNFDKELNCWCAGANKGGFWCKSEFGLGSLSSRTIGVFIGLRFDQGEGDEWLAELYGDCGFFRPLLSHRDGHSSGYDIGHVLQ
jgi:hypothetical protein